MPAKVKDPPKVACYHCGADCYPVKIDREEKSFCCEGCYTVYGLLKDSGMGNYYSLNDHPGFTASGSASNNNKYDYLDRDEVVEQLLEFRDESFHKVKFRAPAIHCTSCIWLLEHLYKLKDGILKSEVNFPKKEVYISYDPEKISLREVVEVMAAIGYAPELSLDNLAGKKKTSPNRKTWFQLGIAGFCFGNIMLFSFPEYLGITEIEFIRLFGYLNILFAIPVVTYSAGDYFRQAYNAIRHRRINMDVPIALGISVLFIRSVVEILMGTGAGFLDSMAGLVFFLLLGRIFQNKTYDALSFDRDYKSYFPISVTRLNGNSEEEIPLSEVEAGDTLLIRNGELVPADAVLLDGDARLDYSFVTGESRAVPKVAGTLVYAGGRQSGSAIRVQAVKAVAQSYLTRLWDDEAFRKKERSDVTRLSDRVGQVFTWAVLSVALISGIVWIFLDAGEAVEVVTAVLIVACPCALALSTPFTLGNSLRILGKLNCFVKGAATVETLANADVIVFDKTGTLTENMQGGIQYEGEVLTDRDQELLRSLLRHSTHPLSRRVYASLPETATLPVENFEEVKGKGIKGNIEGEEIWIGATDFTGWRKSQMQEEHAAGSTVTFRIADRAAGCWILEGQTREGVADALSQLAERFELALISGDNDREKSRWTELFPQKAQLHFAQTPEKKLEFIKSYQDKGKTVLMVGDGLNDAGALAQSDAGISIAEDISAFTPASDVILKGSEVRRLPELLGFARRSMRVIYASFGLSFLYNVIGLAFAVTGNLSPLVAAILMPISSISIIVFATLGTELMARKLRLNNSENT